MIGRLATYLRSFTGFERDARLFLLTTLVSGAAISLYWVDFNLYLAALGIDRRSGSSRPPARWPAPSSPSPPADCPIGSVGAPSSSEASS
jgi:hypothetical protein